jgi:DinB superfamily
MTFDLESAIAILVQTPAVLRVLLSDLPEAWTRGNEGPDTWCAFDVVGHLIDGEETDWIPRARIILGSNDDRRFEPFDRFHHLTANRGVPLSALLDRFAALRAENLAVLRGFRLSPAQMERTGEHPELGTVTLAQLLSTWVVHDLDHLAQIVRVMGKQYTEAVGPWRQHVSVLGWKR